MTVAIGRLRLTNSIQKKEKRKKMRERIKTPKYSLAFIPFIVDFQ